MSGLNNCPNCNQYYAYPEEFDNKLEAVCAGTVEPKDTFGRVLYEGIIKCSCGKQDIVGGELIDGGTQTQGIMMFSHDCHEIDDKDLDVYDAVMLVECDEHDPAMIASTYGRSSLYSIVTDEGARMVYFKPKIDSNKAIVGAFYAIFSNQYPTSPTGRLNKKLFKSWLKRNGRRYVGPIRDYVKQ